MPAERMLAALPAIFREDPFLGQFLQQFEEILLGPSAGGASLEELVSGLARYFDAQQAPAEFLDWLAGWVALNLRADLDEAHRRLFIANAVRLYRLRGTKKGLEEFLQIYTGLAPTISEFEGVDYKGPHTFRVLIRVAQPDPALRAKYLTIATSIIEAEKPAHTTYDLFVETPSMQIGVHSTVGVDTVLDARNV